MRLVVGVLKPVLMSLSLVEMARRLAGRALNQIVRLMWLAVKALRQAGMVLRLALMVLRLAGRALRLVGRVLRLVGTALSLVGRDFKSECKGPETYFEGPEPV